MPAYLKNEDEKLEASWKLADAVLRAWYKAPHSFQSAVRTAAGDLAETRGERRHQGEIDFTLYIDELARTRDEVYLEKVDKQRRYNAQQERLSQAQQDIRRRLLNS